jgi:dihydroorotase
VLERRAWTVPDTVPLGDTVCVPMRAGGSVAWSVVDAPAG